MFCHNCVSWNKIFVKMSPWSCVFGSIARSESDDRKKDFLKHGTHSVRDCGGLFNFNFIMTFMVRGSCKAKLVTNKLMK